MIDPVNQELLLEAVCTAWRPRDIGGGVRAHAAWHDLDAEGRLRAHDRASASRVLEAALDSDGLSSTVHAVLARVRRSF